MEALLECLSKQKSMPMLWLERISLFEKASLDHCIRTIEFRRGMNLIWAKEPPAGSQFAGIHAAGHGVGKTSLCLLIRYCLGDNSEAVCKLKDELQGEFPKGGVAAVIHIGNETYTVFRYFNPYKDGLARAGDDIDALLNEGGDRSYKELESLLIGKVMSEISPRYIPESGQEIEWRHLLAWMTRDQGSRFKSYFTWREGEGVGLQRSRQDPPVVMRAVLGLLEQDESDLLKDIRSLERELESANREIERLKHEPTLIRRRIESELRAWLSVPDDIPLRSDDMFRESVEKSVESEKRKAADTLSKADKELEAIDEKRVDQLVNIKRLEEVYDRANFDYELADAARRQDESAYQQALTRREALKKISGRCEYGEISFQSCSHIQAEIAKLATVGFRDSRDQKVMLSDGEEWTARAVEALGRRKEVEHRLNSARALANKADDECRPLRMKRDSAAVEVDRANRLMAELERWEKMAGSPEAAKAIEQSVAQSEEILRSIERAKTRLTLLKKERSDREKSLAELTDLLSRELLSNEAYGAFVQRDDDRPFQLSVRGGEAYRVLEVLLGDLVCMLDSANSGSAFPGLLVHDCPREADMSSGLYENFLLLVEQIERIAFGDEASFQYIVTTTTPPPKSIQCSPYLRETLDPSSDEGLLFKRRFAVSSVANSSLSW